MTLSLAAVGVGAGLADGNGVLVGVALLLGVADVCAFDGVGVGDLRCPVVDAFVFVFAVAVGVGLGVAVCALRSTLRRAPRPTATSVLAAVADGFTRGLREDKNDRFGVGVGVGAALSAKPTPSINADVGKTNLRFMQLRNS